MKVFLVDNNKISKYILPSKIDDTFLVSYNNGNKDILITLEGKNRIPKTVIKKRVSIVK